MAARVSKFQWLFCKYIGLTIFVFSQSPLYYFFCSMYAGAGTLQFPSCGIINKIQKFK